jgi:hypothetical protein
MNWPSLLNGLFLVLAFLGGYYFCFRQKVWHSVTYERQQKEYEARDDYEYRMDQMLDQVKARGGADEPEIEDSSPFGPVPPTPEDIERMRITKEWEKMARQR